MRAEPQRAASGRPGGRAALAGALAAALLGGCAAPAPAGSPSASGGPSVPPATATASPSASPSPTPSRTPGATPTAAPELRLYTLEAPRVLDPVAATTAADGLVAVNVFQRLLTLDPESHAPKPDAADCLFTSVTTYECTLGKGLTFANGDALTASDVKFSIERAVRLSTRARAALASLARTEVLSDVTVRFTLTGPDATFAEGLAEPAASLVDEQAYRADAVSPNAAPVAGSGPFALSAVDSAGLTFVRNPGYRRASDPSNPQPVVGLPSVRLVLARDSATVEQAMVAGTADAVWRGLDPAALERLAAGVTRTGMARAGQPSGRVQRLAWNPASKARARADVRAAVARALQADRTLPALLPLDAPGALATFPVGGPAASGPAPTPAVALTLGYSSAAPGEADLARLVRDRLAAAGLGVQLRPDAAASDLLLSDDGASVATPLGWLAPYLDAPLPGSAARLAALVQAVRQAQTDAERDAAVAALQQQAAADLTVLPVAAWADPVFLRAGLTFDDQAQGPGHQLGFWGFTT